jgi:uncharacterized protein YaaQ
MKLILTVLRDSDNEPVSQALISDGFRVTRIASTGGFFRRGSSTLMIGVDDEKVDSAIQIIKNNLGPKTDPGTHRAVLFVLNVDHYHHI